METTSTVYTITANCRDCYRCVRVCPVKAISVKDGQASIREDLCIKCGTCVRECPQHAKTIISTVSDVKNLIASGRKVAASVAPSFAAVFSGWQAARLPAALRKLGFSYVSETAEGAALVTQHSFDEQTPGSICTACPAVINYIEKYRPAYLPRLKPITSPMIAHGRLLKQRLGKDVAVVFIGPCAAKKAEALRHGNEGVIDAAITFDELEKWLEEEKIDLSLCADSAFDSNGDLHNARLFPLVGGMMKTGGVTCDNIDATVALSGADTLIEMLNMPVRRWNLEEAEFLFCDGGCINGPGMPQRLHDVNLYQRKLDVLEYAKNAFPHMRDLDQVDDLSATFATNAPLPSAEPDENAIQKVLEQTGKSDPALQLDCGACGYGSCRENAIAVVKGLAEPEMCMPYMRRLAQQRTDRIIETSPNGVVILNENLHIIKTNRAFLKMFHCGSDVIGRRISYFMDAEGFEQLASGKVEEVESIRTKYGMKYHHQLYALRDEKQYVGVFTDISKLNFDDRQLDVIQQQTLSQAKELLNHQIRFSQEMAHFLGKSTAKSEELVKEIVDLYEGGE